MTLEFWKGTDAPALSDILNTYRPQWVAYSISYTEIRGCSNHRRDDDDDDGVSS